MRRTAVLFLLVLLLLPAACMAETRLMVVSDLHYMAPSLYRDSALFLRVLRRGDGKITQYGDELLNALLAEIRAQRPDALVVTGDLTYNGERKSHEALADWFRSVEETGVPVWVIPGNHDINVAGPVGFSGEDWFPAEAVTPELFAALYADFMEPGSAGFSYAVTVGDVCLAMTDVAMYAPQAFTPGLFSDRHAAWLEEVLRQAGDAQVITATHHSLIRHTEFSSDSYLMYGSGSMKELAVRYGVHLNLSGHLHIQHIAREGDLFDAALGAFCMWPHRYALVTLDGDSLRYEAKSLDPAYLPAGFQETSRDWFYGITHDKAKASGITGTGAEIEAMADFAARFNLAYFSGTFRPEDPVWTQDPARALWEARQDTPFGGYLCLVMREEGEDPLRIEYRIR